MSLLSVEQCAVLRAHSPFQTISALGRSGSGHSGAHCNIEGGREGAPSPRGAESKSPPHLHGGREAAPSAPTVWAPLPQQTC